MAEVSLLLEPEFGAVAPQRRFGCVVAVTTGDLPGERPPVEIALVLDVSGSMSGAKLQNCRKAVLNVLQGLLPSDVVHIVTYQSHATVLARGASIADREGLEVAVESLVASGGTNMAAGLSLATTILCDPFRKRELNRRLFLYSDGHPDSNAENAVPRLAELARGLSESGVSVDTFGIGTDINADLMVTIADAGQGKYDFVTVQRIDELTFRALRGVTRLVGARAVVTLKLPSYMKLIDGPADGEWHLGEIRAESRVQTLIQLEAYQDDAAPASPICMFNDMDVIEAVLSYRPIDNPLAPPVQVNAALALPYAAEIAHDAPRNPVVAVAMGLHMMHEALTTAQSLLECNMTTQAAKVVGEAIEALARVEQLDSEGYVETQLRRARRTLERLERQGHQGARRAALELGHQQSHLERLSVADFESSDSSNYTPPRSPVGAAAAHRRAPANLSDDSGSIGSDTEDDDDDSHFGGLHSPAPLHAASTQAPTSQPMKLPACVDDGAAPPEFVCPITHLVMRDPVCTADGSSYDRAAIEKWFASGQRTSPVTNSPLAHTAVIPNFALRSMIANWASRKQQP